MTGMTLLILMLASTRQGVAQASISGEIRNLPAGKIGLIWEEDLTRKQSKLISQIPVTKGGKFAYAGRLSPGIYTLQLSEERPLVLAINTGQRIFIRGNMTGGGPWIVTGSEDTKKLMAYEKVRKASLDRLVSPLRAQIRSLKESGTPDEDATLKRLTSLEIQNYGLHKDELLQYVADSMGTSIAVYATSIRWSGEKNLPLLKQMAQDFEAAHPGTAIASRVSEKVRLIEANTIGGKVAEIRMPDREDRIIPLSSVKAKYILIDFWASWCLPCRGEGPLLVDLYRRFKPLGLEIYGVGLESGKEAWIRAIEKDQRTWINVSTFQGFETPASFAYAVTSLPSNVLIDSTGKIVARDLHGADLKELVERLLTQ